MELAELSLPEIDKVLKTYPWFSLARKEFYLRMVSLGEEYRQEGLRRAAVYVFSREGLLKDGQKIQVTNGKGKIGYVQDKREVENVVFSLDSPEVVETPMSVPEINDVTSPVITLDDIDDVEGDISAPVVTPEPTFSIDSPDEDIEPEPVVAPNPTPQPKREIHVIGGDYFSKEDFETLQSDGKSTLERISMMSCPEDGHTNRPIEDPNAEFDDEDYYTETLARIYSGQGLYKKSIEVYSKLILLYPEKSTYFAALIDEQKKYL